MLPDASVLRNLVREAAREELLPRFEHSRAQTKPDGSLVTEADVAMQQRLAAALARHWPDRGLLGEEMEPADQRRMLAAGGACWILDPLDGTSNFAAGVPLFAVSIALLVAEKPRLGLVYDPIRDECFWAAADGGAWLEARALGGSRRDEPVDKGVAIIDFKRLSGDLQRRLLIDPPYASQRNLGCCALEWAWISAGRGDVYLHGGMRLWDYAAGCLLLAEAGGTSSDFDGLPVLRSTLEARPVLAAPHASTHRRLLAWLRQSPAA